MSKAEIEVEKIVGNIQQKISKNNEFPHDPNKAKRLAVKYLDLEKFSSNPQIKSSIQDKLLLPLSTKQGKLAKIFNTFLYKVFFVVSKIVSPALAAQENFNRYILDELAKINNKSGISFPIDDYEMYVRKQNPTEFETINKFEKVFSNTKDICVVVNNLQGIDELLKVTTRKLFINDRIISDSKLELNSNYEISNIEEIPYLSSRYDKEFDALLVLNALEYLRSYEEIFSFLYQANRVLKNGAELIIVGHKSEEKQLLPDPAKKCVDINVLKFILTKLEFEQNITHHKDSYVIQAIKKS